MIEAAAPVICLDGPSGVGKGTICLAIAKDLGWHILDSGSLYRITALQLSRSFSEHDVNSINDNQLIEITENMPISYEQKNGELVILLTGADVTLLIRN